MKDKITQTIANLIASLIATILSIWRVINWVQVRNVIDLITSFLLMVIALAGLGKILKGWEFPIIKVKTKPEKTYEIATNPDKRMKGVAKVFLKLSELFKRLRNSVWANKLTLSGELLLTSWFLVITHVFFEFYGFDFVNRPWHFWTILAGIVVSYIFLLIVVAKEGIENWDDFVARVGNKKVKKYINRVLKVGIAYDPDKAQNILNKAKQVLREVQDVLDTNTRNAIQNMIDKLQADIDFELAERELEEQKRRERLIALAKEKNKQKYEKPQDTHESPKPPTSGIRRI